MRKKRHRETKRLLKGRGPKRLHKAKPFAPAGRHLAGIDARHQDGGPSATIKFNERGVAGLPAKVQIQKPDVRPKVALSQPAKCFLVAAIDFDGLAAEFKESVGDRLPENIVILQDQDVQ